MSSTLDIASSESTASTPLLAGDNQSRYTEVNESDEFSFDWDTSPHRTASAKSSIFNLVSTIIGGGVLSLSFTLDKCGVILGTTFMIVSAIASNFTVFVLIDCSRKSGARSFETVARKAFGEKAQIFTMCLLVLLTYMILVAYILLVQDLVSTFVQGYLMSSKMSEGQTNLIAVAAIVLISPILCFRTMHALRYSSVFSLFSVLVLAIAIAIRAFERMASGDFLIEKVKLFPSNWRDPFFSLPIVTIAYLCHFNVLPVYGELRRPTRERLRTIVHSTMSFTTLFYMIVGIMGYLYASQDIRGVQDNILNNFASYDWLVDIGRLGLATTILFTIPLLLLPCRDTFYRLIMFIKYTFEGNEDEVHRLALSSIDESVQIKASTFTHCSLTLGIVVSALYLAFAVPSISFVWSIVGSTVGLSVSYVLPCACYIQIHHKEPNTERRKLTAWIILFCSICACIFCTIQSMLQFL